MTEQHDAEENKNVAEDSASIHLNPIHWQGRQLDWLLQWLIKFVNVSSTEIGVTLSIGGSQISGTLISHESYFKQLAKDLAVPFENSGIDSGESLNAAIHSFIPKEHAKDEREYNFVHLKDAKVFTSNGHPIASSGTLWRGKVAAVDGFHLGALVVN